MARGRVIVHTQGHTRGNDIRTADDIFSEAIFAVHLDHRDEKINWTSKSSNRNLTTSKRLML
jgi:hypothetical protein